MIEYMMELSKQYYVGSSGGNECFELKFLKDWNDLDISEGYHL